MKILLDSGLSTPFLHFQVSVMQANVLIKDINLKRQLF